MYIIMTIFAIAGISAGLIVYSETSLDIREKETVKNCHIVMITSLVFVTLFSVIYFSWNLLHHHTEIGTKHSTKMK